MEKFVCVRIVQAWGMDLSLFQFDWRVTWMAFLMNADRTIYARYAARQIDDLEGLRKLLEKTLEVHERYPANKASFEGKKGIALPWKTPEQMPAISERGRFQPAENRKGCIHCHNVQEGATKSFKSAGQPAPERFTAPYPTTQRVGFMLDSVDLARVIDVTSGSPADKGGLKAGDRIETFAGQAILSTADVQHALWSGPDAGAVPFTVEREGRKVDASLVLPAGWRSR
jgi:predicted metalloprotease with PDZ domain